MLTFNKNEIIRIVIAISVSPLLIYLPFINAPLKTILLPLGIGFSFALSAIPFHIICKFKGWDKQNTYCLGGIIMGAFAGHSTLFIFSGNSHFDFIPLIAWIGSFYGLFFAYFFWAVVVNRDEEKIAISSLILVFLIGLPFLLIITD